jgi:hypothetical protein
MRKATGIALLAACLALIGCQTPYQPMGETGGYEDLQLSANSYRITVKGNGFTDRERAVNIAMLRAAELAIGHGFARFQIVSDDIQPVLAGVAEYELIYKPRGSLSVRFIDRTDPAFANAVDAQLIESQLRAKLTGS